MERVLRGMTLSSCSLLDFFAGSYVLETTNSKDAFLCAAVLGFGRWFSFQPCLYRPKIHSNQTLTLFKSFLPDAS